LISEASSSVANMEPNFITLQHKEGCPFPEADFQSKVRTNFLWGSKLEISLSKDHQAQAARAEAETRGKKKSSAKKKAQQQRKKTAKEIVNDPVVLQYLADQQDMVNGKRGEYFGFCDCFTSEEKVPKPEHPREDTTISQSLGTATTDLKRVNEATKKMAVLGILGDISDSDEEPDSSSPMFPQGNPGSSGTLMSTAIPTSTVDETQSLDNTDGVDTATERWHDGSDTTTATSGSGSTLEHDDLEKQQAVVMNKRGVDQEIMETGNEDNEDDDDL